MARQVGEAGAARPFDHQPARAADDAPRLGFRRSQNQVVVKPLCPPPVPERAAVGRDHRAFVANELVPMMDGAAGDRRQQREIAPRARADRQRRRMRGLGAGRETPDRQEIGAVRQRARDMGPGRLRRFDEGRARGEIDRLRRRADGCRPLPRIATDDKPTPA